MTTTCVLMLYLLPYALYLLPYELYLLTYDDKFSRSLTWLYFFT
jgi:hypothetical protein